jgi:hypothetical protein
MSQLILDEQLSVPRVVEPILKWIRAEQVQQLRPGQRIGDDRVPAILRTLKQATFVTIDHDFWDRQLCNPRYCILYFALRKEQQDQLPDLLRALLRQPEFSTRARRMGKLARISTVRIDYWQFPAQQLQRIEWKITGRRKQ